jgi:hypothetical protein
MNEGEVKNKTERWLKNQGFKVKREVAVAENRELIMDFYAYRDGDAPHSFVSTQPLQTALFPTTSSPIILWVECKGDQNLSGLLEGFIRLELAVWLGGGLGMLAAPHTATEKLLRYRTFLSQAENVIALLDAQKQEIHKLKPQK